MSFSFLNISDEKNGNEKIKSCIQCGSCSASCIAMEGMSLSPRKLWRAVQRGMEPDVMESKAFWNCTTCGLCDRRCPRAIPMSQIMVSLREKYYADNGSIKGVSAILDNLHKNRNNSAFRKNRFLFHHEFGR